MDKIKAVICDIDGTVADHTGIRGHYEYEKVKLDKPVWSVINVVKAVVSELNADLIFATGRPNTEQCREDTTAWIMEMLPYVSQKVAVSILFRPEFLVDDYGEIRAGHRDFRPDDVVKEEIYDTLIEPYYDILAVFDDRNRVVDMWRRRGLTCFQVAPGDF
jgi:hypothetical protein